MRVCQGQGVGSIPGPAGHHGSRRSRRAGYFGLLATTIVLSCWTAADAAFAASPLDAAQDALGQATATPGIAGTTLEQAAPAVEQVKQQTAVAPEGAADAVKQTPVATIDQTVVETVKQVPAPALKDTLAGAGKIVEQTQTQIQNTVEQTQAQVRNTVDQTQVQVQNIVEQTQAQIQSTVTDLAGGVEKTVAGVGTSIQDTAVLHAEQLASSGTQIQNTVEQTQAGSAQSQIGIAGGPSGPNPPSSGPGSTAGGPSSGGNGPFADGGGTGLLDRVVFAPPGGSGSPPIAGRGYVAPIAGGSAALGGPGHVTKSSAETWRALGSIGSAARDGSASLRPPAPSLPAPPVPNLPALGSASSFVFLLFGCFAALALLSAATRTSFTGRPRAAGGGAQRFALLLERPG
jgi:hypothetical protein